MPDRPSHERGFPAAQPPSQEPTASLPPDPLTNSAAQVRLAAGTLVSRYRIESVLGEGGMGTVYLARQEKPDRQVALKVIRPGYATERMLRRFELEAELLGRLLHPGIAQIYEAGTAEAGAGPQPFFAMELVRGAPLTKYAQQKHLGSRQRLDLMAKVCDAVQHAHHKGVIHRDLKPGNILVTDEGQPKILDFGVARATDSDIQQTTFQTDVGAIIGTVPYMSPEQVSGDPLELDTRSDVYALGVIAYELLVSRLPYDLQRKMIHEAARIIREDEPTRLSSIDRTLRGDVETIVGHALEKDKNRRYGTASALAADIRRYLADEPIAARPPSTWYQVQKFSKRNRGLVVGLVSAFLLLVAGLIGTTYGLRQAMLARDREAIAHAKAVREKEVAEAERDKADKVAKFMSDMLKGVGPSVAQSRDITMLKEMMDAAAARIEKGDLKSSPEAELRLRQTIGATYVELAQYPEADRMLEPAVKLARSLHSGDHENTAWALDAFARLHSERGELEEAERLYRNALEMHQRLSPHGGEAVALVQNNLAVLLQKRGDLASAEPLYRESLATRRRLFPGDREDIATSLNSMSFLLRARGDRAGAEALSRESLAMLQRLYPGDHPDVATALNNFGVLLLQRGDLAGAEPLLRESLEMMQRLHAGDHPSVAGLLSSVAGVVYTRGDTAGAVPLYRESLEMRRRLFSDDHPSVATGTSNLGRALQRLGDLDGAEPLLRESLEMSQRLFPGDNPNVADGLGNLGELLSDRGNAKEAERLCRESLAMDQRLFSGDHPDVATGLNRLGLVLVRRGDFTGAEPLARDGVAMSERLNGKDHWRTGVARMHYGRALSGLNRASEAEAELIESERVLSTAQGVPPGGHNQCVAALIALYESWEKAEPAKGHGVQAAQWQDKLNVLQVPTATESSPAD